MKKLSLIRVISIFLLLGAPSAAWASNPLECRYLPALFEAFLSAHYAFHTMSDEIRDRTIQQFIKAMDPSKTLLLEQDIAKLKQDLPVVFKAMKSGDCSALTNTGSVLLTRSKENEEFVRGFLGPDYKLDENIELILDPDKRSYAKTVAEKQELMKKYIHFQISNYLLADMKMDEAKKHLVHRYELITKRILEDKTDRMTISFAEAFAQALDPHSSYLSRDELEDFQIQMRLSLEGIGASLSSEDGFTVIEDTIPGGGADRLGTLRPKDKIIAVAQVSEGQKPVPVIDMDLREVVKLIRGKKGTKVKLTILRQGEKTQTFDVTIVRDKIDIKDQAASISYVTRKLNGKTYKLGMIDLPSFYGGGEAGSRSCSEDVKKLLEEARDKQKVDGIVLNLSRNGGGILEEAVNLVGLFIREGGVVGTKSSDGKVEILSDTDDGVTWNGPLVVLTSRLSASASEIVAGALHDYHRALIVGGDHTFGKGTVQKLVGLPMDLGAMKVTIGMFFVPGGESTQHLGVPSDVMLPSLLNSEEVGEIKMDYSLPPQHIAEFLSKDANTEQPLKHWIPVSDPLVRALTEKSSERVSKDAKFIDVKKEIDEAAKNKGVAKLAEIRKKAAKESKEEKKKQADRRHFHRDKDKDLDTPYVQETENILVDMITTRSTVTGSL